MRLPNAERAIIEPAKLQGYILSFSHPLGRFKAAFFGDMGYTKERWERLEADIQEQHLVLDVFTSQETPYGRKHVISGPVTGPSGKTLMLRSVWIILQGRSAPRLVTIYPAG